MDDLAISSSRLRWRAVFSAAALATTVAACSTVTPPQNSKPSLASQHATQLPEKLAQAKPNGAGPVQAYAAASHLVAEKENRPVNKKENFYALALNGGTEVPGGVILSIEEKGDAVIFSTIDRLGHKGAVRGAISDHVPVILGGVKMEPGHLEGRIEIPLKGGSQIITFTDAQASANGFVSHHTKLAVRKVLEAALNKYRDFWRRAGQDRAIASVPDLKINALKPQKPAVPKQTTLQKAPETKGAPEPLAPLSSAPPASLALPPVAITPNSPPAGSAPSNSMAVPSQPAPVIPVPPVASVAPGPKAAPLVSTQPVPMPPPAPIYTHRRHWYDIGHASALEKSFIGVAVLVLAAFALFALATAEHYFRQWRRNKRRKFGRREGQGFAASPPASEDFSGNKPQDPQAASFVTVLGAIIAAPFLALRAMRKHGTSAQEEAGLQGDKPGPSAAVSPPPGSLEFDAQLVGGSGEGLVLAHMQGRATFDVSAWRAFTAHRRDAYHIHMDLHAPEPK